MSRTVRIKGNGCPAGPRSFGTSSSSLTHLRRVPIDVLGTDESLVRDLGNSRDNAGMVTAVINAGTSFRPQVIAKGVETLEQFLTLQSLHCQEGQGGYFRDPLSGNEFATLLKDDCGAIPRRKSWAQSRAATGGLK
jgi:EAL domain-containing protein (putative c-di-GMP-specific phosphodiesterase class I)